MADRPAAHGLQDSAIWELAEYLYSAMEFYEPSGADATVWAGLPARDREFYFFSLDRALFQFAAAHNRDVGRRPKVRKETNCCGYKFVIPDLG